MIKLKAKSTMGYGQQGSRLKLCLSYSPTIALTSLAILVTVFHMINMQDDCLINNTDRTFWAWLLRFSFITGKPLFTTLSSVTSPKPLSQQFVRRADICERCTRNSNSLNIALRIKSATQQLVNGPILPLCLPFMERTSREN